MELTPAEDLTLRLLEIRAQYDQRQRERAKKKVVLWGEKDGEFWGIPIHECKYIPAGHFVLANDDFSVAGIFTLGPLEDPE